jgi:hypothetical protein
VQSSLPVRRHHISASFTSTGSPVSPMTSNLSGRRFLDRSTPDRDTTGVVSRLGEDRGQRKSSIGQGFGLGRTGSLTTKTRQLNTTDSPTVGQSAGYQ